MSTPSGLKNTCDHVSVAKAASYTTQSFELLEGSLPKRVVSLILEWAFDHKKELMENWELAMKKQALKKIDPLV